MYAVIGRVSIKPGFEDQTRAMILTGGIAMVQGLAGSRGGWWSRCSDNITWFSIRSGSLIPR